MLFLDFPLPIPGCVKLAWRWPAGAKGNCTTRRRSPEAVTDTGDHWSAAFIKELMRFSVQFHLERNGTGRIELQDADAALEEMLFSGGSLNLKLLGAGARDEESARVQ